MNDFKWKIGKMKRSEKKKIPVFYFLLKRHVLGLNVKIFDDKLLIFAVKNDEKCNFFLSNVEKCTLFPTKIFDFYTKAKIFNKIS